MSQQSLAPLVRSAAARPEVRRAVQDVYRAAQDEIDIRRPLCSASGRCCRFEEFGHRLFVTTMELANFLHEVTNLAQEMGPRSAAWDGTGCPFQVNRLCGVHAIRPFGCRMFLCDATSTQWQQQAYERFHTELKRLHEHHNVPYRYVEWRQALRELGLAGHAPSASPESF